MMDSNMFCCVALLSPPEYGGVGRVFVAVLRFKVQAAQNKLRNQRTVFGIGAGAVDSVREMKNRLCRVTVCSFIWVHFLLVPPDPRYRHHSVRLGDSPCINMRTHHHINTQSAEPKAVKQNIL